MESSITPFCTTAPMKLQECLGWPMAMMLSCLCVLIMVQYYRITRVWLRQASHLPKGRERWVWISLAWIFRACSIGGYGTVALALVLPEIAYPLKAVFCAVNVVFCEVFLLKSRGCMFAVTARAASLERMSEEIDPDEKMSVSELLRSMREQLEKGNAS